MEIERQMNAKITELPMESRRRDLAGHKIHAAGRSVLEKFAHMKMGPIVRLPVTTAPEEWVSLGFAVAAAAEIEWSADDAEGFITFDFHPRLAERLARRLNPQTRPLTTEEILAGVHMIGADLVLSVQSHLNKSGFKIRMSKVRSSLPGKWKMPSCRPSTFGIITLKIQDDPCRILFNI